MLKTQNLVQMTMTPFANFNLQIDLCLQKMLKTFLD